MRERGDACSADFRQRNTAALTALGGLSLERLLSEIVQTSSCTAAAQQRLLRESPPPPNLTTLIRNLSDIEKNAGDLEREVAVAQDLARRRSSGYEENLRQCR
jgi:hypothetical protein